MKPLIIYHGGCKDGLVSAFLLHQSFGRVADLVPTFYGTPPPDVTGRENVFIVDFSFDEATMREICSKVTGKVVMLDHHKTAQKDLEALVADPPTNLHLEFDMERSGARMTYDFIYKADEPMILGCGTYTYSMEALEFLANYTQDQDLWHWKLPHTREINCYLETFCRTVDELYGICEELISLPTATDEKMIKIGGAILKERENYVNAMCSGSRVIGFEGYFVPVVNASHYMVSEVLAKLCKNFQFAMSYFFQKDGKVKCSLRSSEDGMDVSVIAKKYGGGGHTHAASFILPASEFLALRIVDARDVPR